MKRILVTGANKGIGLAIVDEILASREDTFVLLGARDLGRGEGALGTLVKRNPIWSDRVQVLQIDVADDASVASAAAQVVAQFGADAPLYGVVNNAGVGFPTSELMPTLQVNTYGIRRVCQAFIPLLEPKGGRVVNLTSASGPNYVATCSLERQQVLIDPAVRWESIDAYMVECLSINGGEGAFADKGMGSGSAYGISKACANAYTIALARENPKLVINACTPGFIETDLTRPIATARGVSAAAMGMKPPKAGTVSTLFLLFGEPQGSGHYYGSDALRSPLDRYRSPGDPPYTGS
jgi:NAD(P)-dependent dehydrogenase (short-subunit alcohol dehydrogenase family)